MIIGGSSPETWPNMKKFDKESTIYIGVDRGSLYGIQSGFSLEEALGDFDSLTEEEWGWLQDKVPCITRFEPEKDYTDMELGVLKAIEKYPDAEYYLIGATGGRLDHFLSNLWLPLQEQFIEGIQRIHILDEQNTISYFLPGSYQIVKEPDKEYLAYICLTAVSELSLYDAKYQLDKANFPYPRSLSSNEFIGESSRFSFATGVVSVIQSKDKIKRV